MPFWLVVLAALIGVPCALMFTGMGMIFWVGGLAGGPQASRAKGIVRGWFALAWVLASVFGAFGLAPAWRVWHGGGENFDGGLQTFIDWLVGVGIVAALLAWVLRPLAAADRGAGSPVVAVLRGLLLALGFVPWAALAGWIVWPLVLWPAVGRFEWPDAATGWRRTGAITLALFAGMLVEDAVRRWRKR